MDTIIQSQIFFFISSVGFIVLWILMAIFLFYFIKAMNTFSRIMNKIEKDVDEAGDVSKEMLEDMRDSTIFHFLFGKKKRKHKK